MKKNLKKFVFEQMEKNGDVTSQEVINYRGDLDFSLQTIENYKTQYLRKKRYGVNS